MSSREENELDFHECPICFNKFNQNLIENHVNKCLFLNESTSKRATPTPKRSFPHTASNNAPALKKSKHSSTISKYNEIKITSPSAKTQLQNPNKMKKEWKHHSPQEFIPLAEKMRPVDIISYVGQAHVIGQQSVLYMLLSKTEIPNIILWGPPGCGKTSLAYIIENICKHCPGGKYRFIKLSAAISGVNDIKELVTTASNDLKFRRRTVIFLDEIHRFNKVQQDIFLPHIESGNITLIGATTENPSYNLNSALLSRCRVLVLEKLSVNNLIVILEQAVNTLEGLIIDKSKNEHLNKNKKFFLDRDAINWLAETSDGDARIALGGLELAIQYKIPDYQNDKESLKRPTIEYFISIDDIKDSLKKSHMLYDRHGDQHYDMISALHKSVRSSDKNASLYWLTRMIMSGEDPMYIARRLIRMSSEDIGLKDPKAFGLAVNTMQACKMLGMPECDILLAQCTTYLATAPKSRLMEDALRAAQKFVSDYKDIQPPVPLHLRKKPAKMNLINFDKRNRCEIAVETQVAMEKSYLPLEIPNNVNFFL